MVIGSSGHLPSIIQKEAIIILLSHGADPYISDDLGENSFDYAETYLFDLEELEEGKANTEPTELDTKQSEVESFYMIPQGEESRLMRDFGEE